MSTPLSDLLSLVAAHGKSQASAFLQGEAVIAGSPDQEIWEHLAQHDILWDGLTVDDQDRLRDEYLEGFKQECARRLTGSDPVASPLPISVAQSSSGVDHAFSCLKSIRRYIDGLAEGPHRSAMVKGWNFMVYGVEDPGTVTLQPDWLKSFTEASSPASSVVPAPLVPEVVKTAQEGSVCEVEPLGEVNEGVVCWSDGSDTLSLVPWSGDASGPYFTIKTERVVCIRRFEAESLIAHLQSWLQTGSFDLKGLPSSPPSSEDTGLLNESHAAIRALLRVIGTVVPPGINVTDFMGAKEFAFRTLHAHGAQASTTSQKGGQGV